MESLETKAMQWMQADPATAQKLNSEYYCQTRDVFQARLDRMAIAFDQNYLVTAIAGEIGNNSFDHNVGNWPDVPGIFFGYDKHKVVLADRGQGVFATLKKVKPELSNDSEALQTAFTERLSGRSPERRGNGLKFVRESVSKQRLHLSFASGTAKAELNEKIEIRERAQSIRGCLAVLTISDSVQI